MSITSQHLDYFPLDILSELAINEDDYKLIDDKRAICHTSNIYDCSLVASNAQLIVRRTNRECVATNHHESHNGINNPGIEVMFADGTTDVFYPHQLKFNINTNVR